MAKFTLVDGTEIEAFTADEVYSDLAFKLARMTMKRKGI